MTDAIPDPGNALPSFYRLVRHDRIASTNDEAKRLAAAGAPAGTLVQAVQQTAGRGRQGRAWVSPPGNLYMSMILRPSAPIAVAAQLSFVAAVAVGAACGDVAPDAAIAFKWPNDILLEHNSSSPPRPSTRAQERGSIAPLDSRLRGNDDGGVGAVPRYRKLGGILLESQTGTGGTLDWLVIGIGINLATYPTHTDYPATALSATGADVALDRMLAALTRHFLDWYGRWNEGAGFAAVRAAGRARGAGVGQSIRVRVGDSESVGIFAGLDDDGALLFDTDSTRRRVTSGEVFPAEP
jgi:BirA family biotin operon repressor/biotin-[acetyl-CoA-carboxylase] ligase